MMRLVSQPFDTPKSARSTRNMKSELTRGACDCRFKSNDRLVELFREGGGVGGPMLTLEARKRPIKMTLKILRPISLFLFQT